MLEEDFALVMRSAGQRTQQQQQQQQATEAEPKKGVCMFMCVCHMVIAGGCSKGLLISVRMAYTIPIHSVAVDWLTQTSSMLQSLLLEELIGMAAAHRHTHAQAHTHTHARTHTHAYMQ